MDEKTVNSIWKGFGSYIAKQLRNGKGISVPKFGNFTFTAPLVDLAVSPQLVFIFNRGQQTQEKEISKIEIQFS